MKKILLLLAAVSFTAISAGAQMWAPQAQTQAEPKLVPNADFSKFNKVTAEKMSGLNGFTREGEEEVDYLKFMTYMPGDAEGAYIINFHKVFNGFPSTGTMAVGTVYDYRMVNNFAGNTITEINTWIGAGFSGLKYCIWDAATQEVLWSKSGGLTSGGTEGKSVNVTCDYVVEANRPIIVGYQFTFKNGTIQLPIFDTATPPMGFVVDMTELGATNGFADLTSYIGCTFFVECLTEGEKSHPINDVKVEGMFGTRAKVGEDYVNAVTITNFGKAPVKSVSYTYFDGEKNVQAEISSESLSIPFLGKANLPISAKSPIKGGMYDVKLTVDAINGSTDGYTGFSFTDVDGTEYAIKDNEAESYLLSVENSAVRKVVIEEFTGTWCQYCPSGIVAMDKVEKAYPKDVAVICAHVGDESAPDAMTDQSYAELSFSVGGYPSALLNRNVLVDPYYGSAEPNSGKDISQDIEWMRGTACEARMGVASELSDDEKSINVTAIIEPTMDLESKNYSVTYVLTEDGVTGYEQTNGYASEVGQFTKEELPEDLQFLCDAGVYYKPTFNDVSRLITGVGGIEGSTKNMVFAAGRKVMHNYTITLPSSIADINNVSVTAILIDNNNGEIVTAEKALIGESAYATGLGKVETAPTAQITVNGGAVQVSQAVGEVQVYDAVGKLVANVTVDGTVSVPMFGTKGTYVVRVVTAEGVVVKKVVL